MANYYQLFSEMIPTLTEDERAWVERVLGCIPYPSLLGEATDVAAAENLKAVGIDTDTIDLEDWPGFEWEFQPDQNLWLHADESGNVPHVGAFVHAFLSLFRPTACWHLTWAETCSWPRVGEFGGGALFVTARGVQVLRAADWAEQQRKAFESR